MATNSKIEWTNATWNPLAGCTQISPGCTHCYAATMAKRLEAMGQEKYAGTAERRGNVDVFTGRINLGSEESIREPLKWKKPRMVFVNSMSDLFHEAVPDAFIDQCFAVMALCGRHTFQVLTKRPERAAKYLAGLGKSFARLQAACPVGWTLEFQGIPLAKWPLPNVWIGTSCEDQKRADERIPHLLKCPAAVRFLSCEPLLSGIDLVPYLGGRSYKCKCGFHRTESELLFRGGDDWQCADCMQLCEVGATVDQVIVGGESGHGARPVHPAWVRSLRDQCVETDTAFFFKQWGEYSPEQLKPVKPTMVSSPTPMDPLGVMYRVGKDLAGRTLDGREWSEFPRKQVAQ